MSIVRLRVDFILCMVLGLGYVVYGYSYGLSTNDNLEMPLRPDPIPRGDPDIPSSKLDADELAATGSIPLTPPQRPSVIGDGKPAMIWFDSGGDSLPDTLSPELDQILNTVVDTVKKYPDSVIELTGYADLKESRIFNNISLKRAKSVKRCLYNKFMCKNIVGYKIITVGSGSAHPLDPGNTRDARTKNRRVEIRILTR